MAPEAEYVTRAEFTATMEGLPNLTKLAVIEAIKESVPEILKRVDEKYATSLKECRTTLYEPEKGLIFQVQALNIATEPIPELVKFKWRIWGLITAGNIICILIGFAIEKWWIK